MLFFSKRANRNGNQPRPEVLEVRRLIQAIGEGALEARADTAAAPEDAKVLLTAVNQLLDAALLPIGEGNRILDQIAHGRKIGRAHV